MKQHKFIDLIETSQTVIKQDLLPNSDNKYNLLMIMRSFELLKNYILEQETHASNIHQILEPVSDMPIENNEQALALLSQNIREGKKISNLFTVLESLNNEALKITEPKVAKYD